MDHEEFVKFWDWLLGQALDSEAWWLDTWLERRLEEWNKSLGV